MKQSFRGGHPRTATEGRAKNTGRGRLGVWNLVEGGVEGVCWVSGEGWDWGVGGGRG